MNGPVSAEAGARIGSFARRAIERLDFPAAVLRASACAAELIMHAEGLALCRPTQ